MDVIFEAAYRWTYNAVYRMPTFPDKNK